MTAEDFVELCKNDIDRLIKESHETGQESQADVLTRTCLGFTKVYISDVLSAIHEEDSSDS